MELTGIQVVLLAIEYSLSWDCSQLTWTGLIFSLKIEADWPSSVPLRRQEPIDLPVTVDWSSHIPPWAYRHSGGPIDLVPYHKTGAFHSQDWPWIDQLAWPTCRRMPVVSSSLSSEINLPKVQYHNKTPDLSKSCWFRQCPGIQVFFLILWFSCRCACLNYREIFCGVWLSSLVVSGL